MTDITADTKRDRVLTLQNNAVSVREQIDLMRRLGDDESASYLTEKYDAIMRKLAEETRSR